MRLRIFTALATLLLVGVACSGGGDLSGDARSPATTGQPGADGVARDAAAAEFEEAAAPSAAGDADFGGEASRAQSTDPLPDIPIAGPGRIIKTIGLEIEIEEDRFQRLFARAGATAAQFGGFVTGSRVSESEGRLASGTLTMRVPSDRFEEAVSELKDLGRVTGEERSGRDVSKEFVDLEARLRHAQSQEAFYLRLIDESESISDMIQVQSQLSSVQLRIEEIQGQLNYLKDQTAYSTITLSMFEPGVSAGEPKGLAKAFEQAVDAFQSVVSGLVVAAGWLAPFALVAGGAWLISRLRRRSEGSRADEPTAVVEGG